LQHCVIGDGNLDSRRDILNEPLVGITAQHLATYLHATAEPAGKQLPLHTN